MGCAKRGTANGQPHWQAEGQSSPPGKPRPTRVAAKCGICIVALLGFVVFATTFVARLASIRILPATRSTKDLIRGSSARVVTVEQHAHCAVLRRRNPASNFQNPRTKSRGKKLKQRECKRQRQSADQRSSSLLRSRGQVHQTIKIRASSAVPASNSNQSICHLLYLNEYSLLL